MKSTNYVFKAASLLFTVLLLALFACDPSTGDGGGDNGGGDTGGGDDNDDPKTEQFETREASVDPQETEGPYPPQPIGPDGEEPNEGDEFPVVPTGDPVGDGQPTNPATQIVEFDFDRMEEEAPKDAEANTLEYKKYTDLTNLASPSYKCCPEPSIGENGQTILMSGNQWLGLSKDGGSTFDYVDPTTVFPAADGGNHWDQVVLYVPKIDMFVLMYQTKRKDGKNRIRMAAAKTQDVINSNATSWTYWDFPASVIGDGSWLDFNDMAYGDNNLYMATNSVGKGRVVMRLPLSQIAAKGTITYRYSPPLGTAGFSRISRITGDEAFFGKHHDNSTLSVYSWAESSTQIFNHSVKVNSWPNTPPYTANCPDAKNWCNNNAQGFAWYGVARQDDAIWIAWPATAGEGFAQTHVRLAKVNINNYTKIEEHQIWNKDFAFNYANIATNAEGEVGISLGFGGNSSMYAQHGVGVWGDYVIYTPQMSNICTERWGDYTTVRRCNSNSREWVAAGYLNRKKSDGNLDDPLPHYIRFGR